MVKLWMTLPITMIAAARPRMPRESCVPNFSRRWVSGVSTCSMSEIIDWIRPISVDGPVAVTTPTPVPAETMVDEYAIDCRSPMPASTSTARVSLLAGTDSPVSADSSIRRFVASSSRMSAGTRSPDLIDTTSPGTRFSASTSTHSPSRRARACSDSMFRMPASALSALPSWTNPTTALITATATMTAKSIQSPRIAFSTPAPMRM
ncbi:Uncharacterised protein [Mycobacteroides abscessus subsp. abscessus]|nr:Uncharacterised protein [Mycobacteroides abscessus subsp. abscessus]